MITAILYGGAEIGNPKYPSIGVYLSKLFCIHKMKFFFRYEKD